MLKSDSINYTLSPKVYDYFILVEDNSLARIINYESEKRNKASTGFDRIVL